MSSRSYAIDVNKTDDITGKYHDSKVEDTGTAKTTRSHDKQEDIVYLGFSVHNAIDGSSAFGMGTGAA